MFWDVRPFQGIGPFDFGTPRDSVRGLIGGEVTAFVKARADEVDAAEALRAHFYYDARQALNLVEIFPGGPAIVRYADVPLMTRPLDALCAAMGAIGHPVTREPEGGLIESLGIGLYSPDGGDVSSVTAYDRSRFGSLLEIVQKSAERRRAREARRRAGELPPPWPF